MDSSAAHSNLRSVCSLQAQQQLTEQQQALEQHVQQQRREQWQAHKVLRPVILLLTDGHYTRGEGCKHCQSSAACFQSSEQAGLNDWHIIRGVPCLLCSFSLGRKAKVQPDRLCCCPHCIGDNPARMQRL